MYEGWIKLHRKLLDWEWYSDSDTKDVFIHLLLTANHADGKWRGQEVKKGSVITSLESLASPLGLSIQRVRTALKHLQSTGEIEKISTNKNTKIIVVNYSLYQSLMEFEQQTTNIQPTIKQQSTNNQSTTNKNEKNKKNVKNERINHKFIPPTLEEVQAYIHQKGYAVNAESFINYYESVGWKVGKNSMKNWKSAVSTWNAREKQNRRSDDGIDDTYDLNEIEKRAMFNDDYEV